MCLRSVLVVGASGWLGSTIVKGLLDHHPAERFLVTVLAREAHQQVGKLCSVGMDVHALSSPLIVPWLNVFTSLRHQRSRHAAPLNDETPRAAVAGCTVTGRELEWCAAQVHRAILSVLEDHGARIVFVPDIGWTVDGLAELLRGATTVQVNFASPAVDRV